MDKCPVSGETVEEERFNYLTHLFGLILSLVGWVVLLVYAYQSPDGWHLVGSWIYGATLVLLYAASTFYHLCQKLHYKHRLKIVDHICIYLLITGSFVPFALGPIRHLGGPELLAVELVIMLGGILLKIFYVDRFPTLSLIFYLAMGWLGALSFPAMMEILPWTTVLWIVLGGFFYTFGTIFYVWEAIPFNHAIWHLFVMGGSSCHYLAIFNIVQQRI